MNYIECSIVVEDNETEDILIAFLGELEFESFDTENGCLKAYIQKTLFDETSFFELLRTYKIEQYEVKEIEQENWNAQWESQFVPVIVDDTCIVRAGFHVLEKDFKYDVVIDPKMSFGTGHHETTHLMIQAILKEELEGKTVVDCGCGTGVLAILAAKKNAKHVDAFDIDEWSYENTLENIISNNVDTVEVRQGGLELLEGKLYDLILANINKNVLLESMVYFAGAMHENSKIIFSGIYNKDLDDLKDSACKVGLKFVSFSENNSWISCLFKMA